VADEKIMIIVGEGVVRKAPVVFSSVGLGSCVVVTLYDTKRCIGGLAHIMVPGNRRRTTVPLSAERGQETIEEKRTKGIRYEIPLPEVTSIVLSSRGGNFFSDPAKAGDHTSLNEVYHYADTAIVALLKEMTNKGASLPDMVAKIAGGAKMFADGEPYEKSIGGRNVKSIKQLLKKERIPVVGEDTGASHGRNVDFYLDSGRVSISTIGGMDKEI
jgi:chemotaxis receptor (MCP) glutamine deamidase CheD